MSRGGSGSACWGLTLSPREQLCHLLAGLEAVTVSRLLRCGLFFGIRSLPGLPWPGAASGAQKMLRNSCGGRKAGAKGHKNIT